MDQPATSLPDRIKLPIQFDKERLLTDLTQLEKGAWLRHFVQENYSGDWEVMPLRGPKGATHPVMMMYSDPSCSEFDDTPFLDQCPYIQELLKRFPFELHAVRLMALSPGSVIKEHRDHDLALEQGAVRLHIPIRTSEQVIFRLNGKRVMMAAGECWYLRLSDPHSVENRGSLRRVHLVIDAPATNELHRFLIEELAARD